MQRISTLASLMLFMLILSWISYSFEGELLPRNGNSGDSAGQELPVNPDNYTGPRIYIPDRSEIDPPPVDTFENGNDGEAQDHPEQQGSREKREIIEQPAEKDPLTDPEKTFESKIVPKPAVREQDLQDDTGDDGFHFLLLGRKTGCPEIGLAMFVTLVPESHARLTALDLSIVLIINNEYCLLENAFNRGAGFNDLGQALELKTGLQPRFYIDLNLDGFVKMIDMLGGVDYRASRRVSAEVPFLEAGLNLLDGSKTLQFLQDDRIGTVPRETLLINMLTAASYVDNTSLGISLLWTGYRNIKTDLSIGDLLELRRVTQGISPTTITLREINQTE